MSDTNSSSEGVIPTAETTGTSTSPVATTESTVPTDTSTDTAETTAAATTSRVTTSPTTSPDTPTATPTPSTTTTSTSTSIPTTTTPPTTSTTSTATTPTTTETTPSPTPRPTSSTITSESVATTVITSNGSTQVRTVTSTLITVTQGTTAGTEGASSATSSGSGIIQSGESSSNGGLNQQGKIAVPVVVPIVAVALFVVAGIFFWRKRKQRKDAEEERRKEVEDYIYNPNADPTLPDVGGGVAGYEMREDGSSGYRGWGSTTLAGSTGRKASTMSGGAAGAAYSDANSHSRGISDTTRSGEPLMTDGSHSREGEILGAMGPATSDNRGNVRRGHSNASSSYSGPARSDGSGENGVGVAYGGSAGYYDQYGNSNPYENQRPGAVELGGQPIIRDNPARRNTRIENPSHYPQQSAGISQNF